MFKHSVHSITMRLWERVEQYCWIIDHIHQRYPIFFFSIRGRSDRDRMVVGFITTCEISTYHHLKCEFEPCSWRGVIDTTICGRVGQWLMTGRWFSHGTLVSSTNKTVRHDITEILCHKSSRVFFPMNHQRIMHPKCKCFSLFACILNSVFCVVICNIICSLICLSMEENRQSI